jgi:hypothetical protein
MSCRQFVQMPLLPPPARSQSTSRHTALQLRHSLSTRSLGSTTGTASPAATAAQRPPRGAGASSAGGAGAGGSAARGAAAADGAARRARGRGPGRAAPRRASAGGAAGADRRGSAAAGRPRIAIAAGGAAGALRGARGRARAVGVAGARWARWRRSAAPRRGAAGWRVLTGGRAGVAVSNGARRALRALRSGRPAIGRDHARAFARADGRDWVWRRSACDPEGGGRVAGGLAVPLAHAAPRAPAASPSHLPASSRGRPSPASQPRPSQRLLHSAATRQRGAGQRL